MTPDPFHVVLWLVFSFSCGVMVGLWLANRCYGKELDRMEARLAALGRRIDRVRG